MTNPENIELFYAKLYTLIVESFNCHIFTYTPFKKLLNSNNVETYDVSFNFKAFKRVEYQEEKEKFLQDIKILLDNQSSFLLKTNKPSGQYEIVQAFLKDIYHLAPTQFQYVYENYLRIYSLSGTIEYLYTRDHDLLPKLLTYQHGLHHFTNHYEIVINTLNVLGYLKDKDNWDKNYCNAINESLLVFFEQIKDSDFFLETHKSINEKFGKTLRQDESIFLSLKQIVDNAHDFLPYFPQFPSRKKEETSLFKTNSNALTKLEISQNYFFSNYDSLFIEDDAQDACKYIVNILNLYNLPDIKSIQFINLDNHIKDDNENSNLNKNLENKSIDTLKEKTFDFIVESNTTRTANIELVQYMIAHLIGHYNDCVKNYNNDSLHNVLQDKEQWLNTTQKILLEYTLKENNKSTKRVKL